jgi:hypothetical protein
MSHRRRGIILMVLGAQLAVAGCDPEPEAGRTLGAAGNEESSHELKKVGCKPDDFVCQVRQLDSGTKAKVARLKSEMTGAQLYVVAQADGDRSVVNYYDYGLGRWFDIEASPSAGGEVVITRGVYDDNGLIQNYFGQTYDMKTDTKSLVWKDYAYAASVVGVGDDEDFDLHLDGAALRAMNTDPAPGMMGVVFLVSGGRVPNLGRLPLNAVAECTDSCGLTGGPFAHFVAQGKQLCPLLSVIPMGEVAHVGCAIASEMLGDIGIVLNTNPCVSSCGDCYADYEGFCRVGGQGSPPGCSGQPFECREGRVWGTRTMRFMN